MRVTQTKRSGETASENVIDLELSTMATKGEVRFNGTVGKRLLNVREAAEYLGLDVDTVYRKARLRELPSVKVGRALRFDIRALDRLIEQNAKPIA